MKKLKARQAAENKQYWSTSEQCTVQAVHSCENGGTWFWAFQGWERPEEIQEILAVD